MGMAWCRLGAWREHPPHPLRIMTTPRTTTPRLTPDQARAIQQQIRELTNHGQHLAATMIYNEYFPQV